MPTLLTGAQCTVHCITLSNTILGTLLSAPTAMYFSHKVVRKFHSGKELFPFIITIRQYFTHKICSIWMKLGENQGWKYPLNQTCHYIMHSTKNGFPVLTSNKPLTMAVKVRSYPLQGHLLVGSGNGTSSSPSASIFYGQHHSTNTPYPFIHLPLMLYNLTT